MQISIKATTCGGLCRRGQLAALKDCPFVTTHKINTICNEQNLNQQFEAIHFPKQLSHSTHPSVSE